MIIAQEKEIITLLQADGRGKQAFYKMLSYYEVYDKMHFTSHAKLIKAIYIEPRHNFIWELTNVANMGLSSIYKHRKNYIACFYVCFSEFSNAPTFGEN